MDPILNELSIAGPNSSSVDERLFGLARVLAQLAELGFARVLRSTQEALTIPFGNGLTLPGWAAQRGADRHGREARQLLMARLGRAPFVERLLAEVEDARGRQFEARCAGQVARGLAAALLLDSVATSVPGAPDFEIDPLRVELDVLDDTGVLTVSTEPVPHVHGPTHVEAQREVLRERVLRRVENGAELWRRRTELLAGLDFCDRVQGDLVALTGHEPWFFEICRHLAVLSDSIGSWSEGEFNPNDVTWSHEGKTTLNHGVYGPQREFDTPDGRRRQFSSHTKLNSVGWRIYFLSDAGTRRALIGYVGPHLDTMKFH